MISDLESERDRGRELLINCICDSDLCGNDGGSSGNSALLPAKRFPFLLYLSNFRRFEVAKCIQTFAVVEQQININASDSGGNVGVIIVRKHLDTFVD